MTIDDLTYQELDRYRFWARDVILKSWFSYSLEGEKTRNNAPNIDIQLYKLLGYIYNNEYSREPVLISQYRTLYEKFGTLKCVYSGKEFKTNEFYHLDHLLPWVYYPENRFWNLYPCEPSINLRKTNLLPKWKEDLEKNIRLHISLCLKNVEEPIIKNDLYYFYIIKNKNHEIDINKREKTQIEEELINFIKLELNNLSEIIPGQLFSNQIV